MGIDAAGQTFDLSSLCGGKVQVLAEQLIQCQFGQLPLCNELVELSDLSGKMFVMVVQCVGIAAGHQGYIAVGKGRDRKRIILVHSEISFVCKVR